MKRITLWTLTAAVLVAGLSISPAHANDLFRIVSESDFDGFEASTTKTEPGVVIWRKTFSKPGDHNTLYITMATTGDVHQDDEGESEGGSLFGCFLDGVSCNPKERFISLQQQLFDLHDNSITYTWCTEVDPAAGLHTVELRMASANGNDAYIESAMFIVDSTKNTPRCRASRFRPFPDNDIAE